MTCVRLSVCCLLLAALRSVLVATGGQAKVRELYSVPSAGEAAEFPNLALQTVRNMTARHELPCTKIGKRGVGYQLIDLIALDDGDTCACRCGGHRRRPACRSAADYQQIEFIG